MFHRLSAGAVRIALVCALIGQVRAETPAFEQISPPGGFPEVEFQQVVTTPDGKFVALTRSAVFVGSTSAGTVQQVLSDNKLGFLLTDDLTQTHDSATRRMGLAQLGQRLAMNDAGDYVLASHTCLFVGSATGGVPRKVFEDKQIQFQKVAIAPTGHYVALTRKGILAGHTSQAAATRMLESATGVFDGHDVAAAFGDWDVEVGQTHLAVDPTGRFLATSTRAVYAGSVPAQKIVKVYEDSKTAFRQLQLAADGSFVILSARNVFRGHLDAALSH